MNNKITIITATLNAEKYIYRLIKSLQNQTDKTFDWIVIDGGSTDSTHEAIIKTVDLNVHFFCSPDFGIYDALNKGVRRTTSGYYLIVGADDVLTPNAIESYKKTILKCNADIITTVIKQNNKLIMPKSNFGWLYGLPGVASSHAVGMLFKVELHERFGFYSHKLPIAADQLFVKNALAGGATIFRANFLAGEFSSNGTSGNDPIGLLTELFRVQLITEKFHSIQFLLFFARLIKYYVIYNITKLYSLKKIFSNR